MNSSNQGADTVQAGRFVLRYARTRSKRTRDERTQFQLRAVRSQMFANRMASLRGAFYHRLLRTATPPRMDPIIQA